MSVAAVLAASPGRLRAAAARLGHISQGLASQASSVEGAGDAAIGAWSGIAADMFQTHCSRLCADGRTGSDALARAGGALSTLANSLEYAQQLARESQSLAASAASLRAQASTMEPSPMIRLVTEEAYAAAGRSAALEAEADRVAREAAARAAAVFDEVTGAVPSRRDGAWGSAMHLNAADLAAYLRMDLSSLPDEVQALAGRELAEMLRGATGENWDEAEAAALIDVLEDNAYNGDFAAGFFNAYGAHATAAFVHDLQVRYGEFRPGSERFTRPLSIALGSASRAGLDEDFLDGLLDGTSHDGSTLHVVSQLVEHGTYGTDFAVALGDYVVQQTALDPTAVGHRLSGPDGSTIDLRSVILHAVSRTPDAARDLLLMRLDEPVVTNDYVHYIDILMAGYYSVPDSGVGALIEAATIGVDREDRHDAARVVLLFVTHAPDIDATYGLHTDVTRAAGAVAAEWWDEFANVSYRSTTGAAWTEKGFAGEVTDAGRVHLSMDDALSFLEIAVSDPDGRAEVKGAVDDYTTRMVEKALDMPPGDERDHVMQRMGASLEAFSIADSRVREVTGIHQDQVAAIERKVAGLLTGQLLKFTGPPGTLIGLFTDEYLDGVFASAERANGLKAGSLQDLQLRLEYKLEVVHQALERGSIPPEEEAALLRFLFLEGESEFDGIRHVTRLIDSPGLENVMNGLRSEYLYADVEV